MYSFVHSPSAYSLPVLIHTKNNMFSGIEYVINVAKEHPDMNIILGHMGAGTDGKESLEAIKLYDNIYGDTAWVRADVVKQAESLGIGHKIMFGTDSPIGQMDRYALPIHAEYFSLEGELMKGIMGETAKMLFKI